MLKLDRYLLGDFVQSFLATLIVLLVVSVGGVLVDILGNIADGRLPAKLLFSQLGLQFIAYLPLILPLALMLGLLLAIARLYRDSEMAVITAIGVGPKRLLRPLLMLVVPVVLLVGACSLWLGPWAGRVAEQMIIEANRSVLMAGLEPGRFTPLPNGGVVYLSSISPDGTQLGKVFLQRQKDDRLEVVSANSGRMYFEGTRQRFLELDDGHQVEGPVAGALDYRLATFARNDVALPDGAQTRTEDDPELMPTLQLIGDARPQAQAQLHRRLAPPLIALAFALLTVPLGRSSPRQQRYGRMMLALMAYMVGTNLMFIGSGWIANGKIPAALGLWWLTVPLLALAIWMYVRDGRLGRPKEPAHEAAPDAFRPLPGSLGVHHGAADLGGAGRPGRGDGLLRRVQDIGKNGYTLGHAAAWVLYTVPRRAYTMFPTAAVIGALMGLGQLAATSELTALRALGLSRKRLSVSVAIALSLLTAVMVLSAETLGPWGQDRADALKSSAKWGRDISTTRYSGLWAREGDTFLNAQSGEEQLVGDKGTRLILRDVRLYRIAEDGNIASLTHAATAEHDKDGWVLTGVRRDTFGERSATRQEVAREPWNSKLDAAALATGIAKPRNLSVAELSTSIAYRQRNGLDARDFEDVYWSRWFYPVNVLALCLAAVPFAFGSLRSGGMGKRLFLGILFALGFWLLQLFFGRMAGALKFDYRIAYALPPIVMLAVSGLLFRRKSG